MNIVPPSRETIKVLALTRYAGVGARLFVSLVHHFGNLERIIRADSGTLMAIDGIKAEVANLISSVNDRLDDATTFAKEMLAREIGIVSRFDDLYPQHLFELNNPPPILFYRGQLPENGKKSAVVTGSENATNEGISLTVEISEYLARAGVSVVSSLSPGIDASVHLGCKKADQPSFAVLDSGFDNIYPEENIPVAIDIANNGGLLTEHSPELNYNSKSYQSSNRIIAGLCQAVVITEIYKDSKRTIDLINFCNQIGKLTFILIDPEYGAHADEPTLNEVVKNGANPIVGKDKIKDIVDYLV